MCVLTRLNYHHVCRLKGLENEKNMRSSCSNVILLLVTSNLQIHTFILKWKIKERMQRLIVSLSEVTIS